MVSQMRNFLTVWLPVNLTVLTIFLLFFHFNLCVASGIEPAGFNLTEISAGIFVHQGRHVDLEHPQHDDIANIGFIVGQSCVAVIDTGGSIRTGTLLREAIHKVTSVPVCYVVNTHVHYDHLLGNIAFKSDHIKFIGHAKLAEAIPRNRLFFLDNYAQDLGPDATAESIIAPDIVVEETMQLDLGNRILTLTAHQTAHSHTDLSIYDQRSQTLWLSDLLFVERIPALDGSLKGWLTLLDKLEGIKAKRVVPGHGPISGKWPESNIDQKRYLSLLLQQTREMIAKGRFLEEAIESVANKEKQTWQLYEQHHKRNVTRAFLELEWE